MTENEQEQISNTTPSAESVDNAEENSFGQFKTKEGLMDAYKSLQAEFTRRSQRLKALEAEVNKQSESRLWDDKVNALTQSYPVAKDMSGELKEYLSRHTELAGSENDMQMALLGVLAEKANAADLPNQQTTSAKAEATTAEIPPADANTKPKVNFKNDAERRAIVLDYIRKQGANMQKLPPVMTDAGGEIPIAIVDRPKDFRSARSVAEIILKQNKQ